MWSRMYCVAFAGVTLEANHAGILECQTRCVPRIARPADCAHLHILSMTAKSHVVGPGCVCTQAPCPMGTHIPDSCTCAASSAESSKPGPLMPHPKTSPRVRADTTI